MTSQEQAYRIALAAAEQVRVKIANYRPRDGSHSRTSLPALQHQLAQLEANIRTLAVSHPHVTRPDAH